MNMMERAMDSRCMFSTNIVQLVNELFELVSFQNRFQVPVTTISTDCKSVDIFAKIQTPNKHMLKTQQKKLDLFSFA